MYFLLAFEPLTSTSILSELFTSKKIIIKKIYRKNILTNKSICRFASLNFIKLLSIKVKKVKKPNDNFIIKIIIINKFFLINSIIMQ